MGLLSAITEEALKYYDKSNKREELAPNKRIFLETVLDQNKEKITEKDLSPEYLNTLRQLIQKKYSSNTDLIEYVKKSLEGADSRIARYKEYVSKANYSKKDKEYELANVLKMEADKKNYENFLAYGTLSPTILKASEYISKKPLNNFQYEDYVGSNLDARQALGMQTPEQGLQTLLGRFNFDVTPTGNIVIKDMYDFNPQGAGGESGEGDFIYNMIRSYAGEKVPPGKGREVLININQTGLEPTIK